MRSKAEAPPRAATVIAAPSARVPCSSKCDQTLSARNPRDSSIPKSTGQGAFAASPRALPAR